MSKNLFSVVFFFFFTMMAGTAMANPSQWLAPCPDKNGQCLWYNCRDSNGVGECTDAQPVVATAPAIQQRQPAPQAPEAKAEAKPAPAPEDPTHIPWGWITAGLIAVGIVLYGWRCQRIRAAQALYTVENAVISAWLNARNAMDNERAMTWALVERWRHLHPGQAILTNGQVGVNIDPHNGHIPVGAPFTAAP